MLTGPVGGVVKDLAMRLRNLSGKNIEDQISDLFYVIAKARWGIAELEKERRFERTLEIFNQHGAEANPPFGAMLINGRVLVCNYRTVVGVWVNGHVKDKGFTTREVEIRKVWPKGEKGYE